MRPAGPEPRRRRLKQIALPGFAALVIGVAAASWYVTTEGFQAVVRDRAIREMQRITGGRVEMGSIHTRPFLFQVEIRDVTVHGRESATEIPYAHIDRADATLKFLSVIGVKVGFRSLTLDHPVIHIVFYPDGTTNQPGPLLHRTSNSVERLFALSISDIDVRRGELLWGDKKIPLEFQAHDISAGLDYSYLRGRYEGELLARKIDSTIETYRPFTWMAEAHFNFGRKTLDFKSLKLSSGRSEFEASGRVANFSDPRVEGTYSAAIDLAELGTIAHRSEVQQGLLQADGTGSWSATGLSSTGTAALRDLSWHDSRGTLKGVAVRTQFAIDDDEITLSKIQGKLLGGSISGEGQIKVAHVSSLLSNDANLDLKLNDISLAEVANSLSSQLRPFSRMRLVSGISGKMLLGWRKSVRDAEARFEITARAPLRATSAELPVEGHCSGTYRAALQQLQVNDLTARTRATEVTGAGTISSKAQMQFSATTSDLSELQRVLSAAGYDELASGTLSGEASFTGGASGKMSSIAFAGEVRSRNGRLWLPASTEERSREISWDSLSLYIQLSPSGLVAQNGVLRSGDSAISFDGRTSLEKRRSTDASVFTARLVVHHGEAATLLPWTGYSLPVKGTIDVSLQASGKRMKPQAQAEIELTHAKIYGYPVQRAQSKVKFDGNELSLQNVRAFEAGEEVTGRGVYNLETQTYMVNAKGTNFHLEQISELQDPRLMVDGRMDFSVEGQGTVAAPALNGNVRLTQLSFRHQRIGNFNLVGTTQGSDLHVTGHSQFEDADVELDGTVHLRGDLPCSVALHFNDADISPLLRVYLRDRVTGPSAVAGDVRIQGPLKHPSDLQVTSSFSDVYLDVEHMQFRNNGVISVVLAHGTAGIQQFRMIGQDTDLMISGTAQFGRNRALSLRAKGQAGLRLIHSLNPEFTSSGAVGMDVEISGNVGQPNLQGHLQLTNGSLAYADLPGSLTEINGALVFTENRLKIETLTARLGGGTIALEGYASFNNRQLNFNVGLRAEDVRLRYPQGISSIMSANLRLSGTPSASTLDGQMVVNKLAVTPGFDFGAYLQRSSQSTVLPETDPLLNRIRLDVHINTAPQLQMQTAVLRLSGDADLRLRGTAAKPVLLGRADVMEGEIYVNGAKYRMERGDVSFNNPATTTAVLDLQATTRVRDYDITVNLNGSLDKLNLSYHSEPPLSTADIINLLALGQTQLQSAQLQQTAQTPFTQEASSAILAEALNTAVSNRSQRLFGMSHIKIDPQGLNTETAPTQTTPAVTIEQQVRDNLTLTYTTNVSQTSQQIIQGEYNISRDLSILGIRDYNGVVSFEIRLRRRRR